VRGRPIWGLISLYYRERIEALKEQVNVLRQQIQFLEAKLKAPAQFPVNTSAATAPAVKETTQQQVVTASEVAKVRYPLITKPKRLIQSEVWELANFTSSFMSGRLSPPSVQRR
jgi:hypothetical protein